jgi:hypothetical protein
MQIENLSKMTTRNDKTNDYKRAFYTVVSESTYSTFGSEFSEGSNYQRNQVFKNQWILLQAGRKENLYSDFLEKPYPKNHIYMYNI